MMSSLSLASCPARLHRCITSSSLGSSTRSHPHPHPLPHPHPHPLQGELLDQIEYTVSQSVNYTGKAVEELRTANKYQKQVRKKMCCVIVVVLIIIIAIAAPLIANRKDES